METIAEANRKFDSGYTLPFDGELDLLKSHSGTITVRDRESGKHFTVRIKRQTKDNNFKPGVRLIALMRWENGQRVWENFGEVKDGELPRFEERIHVWKSRQFDEQGRDSKYAIVSDLLQKIHLAPRFVAKMAGHCRICNKLLTNPDSIDSGIGPECAKRLHAAKVGAAPY